MEQERKTAFARTKETFTTSYDCTDEDIEAFLLAFEGEEETPDDDPRLESEVTQFEWLAEDVQPSLFLTEYREVDGYKAIALLND